MMSLVVSALAGAGNFGTGQSAQPALTELLEAYRTGESDAAVAALAAWPAEQVNAQSAALVASGITSRTHAALVLLHTEAGLQRDDFGTIGPGRAVGWELGGRSPTEFDAQYRHAVGGIDHLLSLANSDQSLVVFLRNWHAVVASRLPNTAGLVAAPRFPNDALSLIVSGTTKTQTAIFSHPGQGPQYFIDSATARVREQLWNKERPGSLTKVSSGRVIDTGVLQEAEHMFRQAMKLDPTLVEAELRLGSLLQLADRPREAERAYRAVLERATGADRGYSGYLAALFLGQVLQARQEWAPAQEAYEQAVQLRPDARSARMAIADLHVVTGRADAAWHTAEALLTPPPLDAAADPLTVFRQGQTSRHDQLLTALRAYVRLP